MNTELDSLEIRVQSEAQSAAAGLDKLIGSLTQLKGATKGVTGLSRIATGLERLNKALSGLQVNKKALGDLRSGLSGLSGIRINLTTTANQISKLNSAMQELNVDDAKLQKLVTSLNGLGQVQKSSGLNSAISALRKLPEVSRSLSEMDMDEFARQIQRVTAALAPLASQMDRVSRGFSAFPARIQRIIQSNESLRSSNTRVANSFSLLSGPISSVIAKLAAYGFSVQQVVSFLADSVMSINEYVENVNLFQVSMGEFYDEAFAYAQLVNEKLGVDPSQWIRAQGVFMSIARGFGVSREQAYALSEGLTELSYDLSSLYNEDVESSVSRLQSALTGEIEPIRRLGISITEATLKEYALSKGITESVESMTEQEKALLRTMKLMEGSATIGAIGDFARTLESPANALRVLKQELTQLSRSIGSVLIPILVQVLPYVQAVVSVLTDIISALAKFLNFEMPEWDTTASWGTGITTGAENAADAMDTATDAAKALKTATLGIDELNILSPDTGSAGASGGAGSGSNWAEGLEIPDIWDKSVLAGMESEVNRLKEQIKPLVTVAVAVGSAFLAWKIGSAIFTQLSSLKASMLTVQKLFSALAGSAATKSFFSWLSGVLAAIVIQFNAAGGGVNGFIAVLKMLASASAPVVAVLVVIASTLKVLISRWEDIKTAIKSIFDELGISEKLQLLQEKLNDLGLKLGWVDGFWNGLKSTIGKLMDLIGGTVITLVGSVLIGVFNGLISVLSGLISIVSGVIDILSGLGKFIAGVFTGDLQTAKEGVNLVGKGIQEVFGGLWEAVAGGVSAFVNGVLTAISELGGTLLSENIPTIIEGIKNWWSDVVKFFTEAVPKWWNDTIAPWFTIEKWKELGTQAIDGLLKGLSGIGDRLASWGEGVLNGVKDVFSPGGISIQSSSKYVGAYASGGYPDQGQLFLANEAGPELVGTIGGQTAVANTQQIVQGISNGVAQANMAQNDLLREQNELLRAILAKEGVTYLDGKRLYRSVEKASRNTGVMIMTGGMV